MVGSGGSTESSRRQDRLHPLHRCPGPANDREPGEDHVEGAVHIERDEHGARERRAVDVADDGDHEQEEAEEPEECELTPPLGHREEGLAGDGPVSDLRRRRHEGPREERLATAAVLLQLAEAIDEGPNVPDQNVLARPRGLELPHRR